MAATLPKEGNRRGFIEDATNSEEYQTQRARRQWNVQDGPRGLLRRLRSQLAEDGDPESQVVLGKALLDAAEAPHDVTIDAVDCSRQAVYWLSKASLQGHDEATTLLQHCLNTDNGISEHNYHEVQRCLAMDTQEKLARRATLQLFNRLSDGNDFITSSMLATSIRELMSHKQQEEEESADCQAEEPNPVPPADEGSSSLETRYGGERFVEEHLTAAATSYFQGHLPLLQHFLPSFQLPEDSYNSSGCPSRRRNLSGKLVAMFCFLFHKLLVTAVELSVGFGPSSEKDVRVSAPGVIDRAVKYLGVEVVRKVKYWYYGFSATRLIMLTLMVLSILSVVSKDTLFGMFPSIVSLISVLVMMVSTCTILVNYRHFDEFKVWSIVLKHHCPQLNTDSAEEKFQTRWFVPYLALTVALVTFLCIKPFVLSALICILLPVMALFSCLALCCSFKRVGAWEHIVLATYFISYLSNDIFSVIAKDYMQENIPKDLYPYVQQLHKLKLDVKLSSVVSLHLGPLTLFQIIWLMTILISLIRKGFIRTSTLLVTSTWCSLTLNSVSSHDVRSNASHITCLWVAVILCPIIWRLAKASFPVWTTLLICYAWGANIEVTSGVVGLCSVCHFLLQKYRPKLLIIARKVWLVTCILMLILHVNDVRESEFSLSKTHVSFKWDSYQNICLASRGNPNTEAQSVVACHRLQGMLVSWQGTVTDVSITSLTNWPEYFLTLLPLPEDVKEGIACNIGLPAIPCDRSEMPLRDYERCVLLASIDGKEKCSLDNWNHYDFDVSLSMDSTYWKLKQDHHNVVLTLDDRFKDIALGLNIGDPLEFNGILSSGVGTNSLNIVGVQLKCSNCEKNSPELLDHNHTLSVYQMVSSVVNYFLAPLISID